MVDISTEATLECIFISDLRLNLNNIQSKSHN